MDLWKWPLASRYLNSLLILLLVCFVALNKAASDSGFLVLFFICNLQILEQVISKVHFYLVSDSIMVSGSSVKKKSYL